MKIGLIGAAAVAAIVVVGCGKKDAEPQGAKAEAAAASSVDPDKVAVLVNGEKLTYGKLDGDVAKMIAAQNVPAEQLDAAKKFFRDRLAQQFAMMTILLGEAEKKGVKLTDEERKKREAEILKSVAGRPGAPKTIDELLAQHPFGK
jgi:flavin reductase (DIM6/NTAB) family NADH-FMN oxidoreductase RutF